MAIMTGLSGNEMFCLHLKGFAPGELVIGNSVYSMGFVGSIGAGLKTMMGGEIEQVTQIVHEGRQSALERMVKEAEHHSGIGITGVSSELIWQSGMWSFSRLARASTTRVRNLRSWRSRHRQMARSSTASSTAASCP